MKRALWIVVGSACALFVLLSAAGGLALAEFRLHPYRNPIPPRPFNAQDVSIPAADGVTLRAWFATAPDPNGDAVILLHGIADNRGGMAGYGDFFLRHGYSVLLPDSRAHGESGGGVATFGLRETDDVHRWADWLEAHAHPHCLYGMGESMGAAILLQSLAHETRFCAVVAESPFADFRSAAYDQTSRQFGTGPWLGKTLLRPAIEFALLYTRARYGLHLVDASPRDAVAQTQTPVLLIHGLSDTNLRPENSRKILAARSSNIQLWEVPGATHCAARSTAPVEFEVHVLVWFTMHSTLAPRDHPL